MMGKSRDIPPTAPAPTRREAVEAALLQRLQRFKQAKGPTADLLGPAVQQFFKQSVQKRQTRFAQIAEAWATLVPQSLNDHCALESFHRGTLMVLVDSSSHLYELKHQLLAGLQKQLLTVCRGSGLRKITLKPGRWYQGDDPAERRVRFD